jgi:hypothetical protein
MRFPAGFACGFQVLSAKIASGETFLIFFLQSPKKYDIITKRMKKEV